MFLKPDVEQLRSFENKIDDEIHGAGLQSFHAISDIYSQRLLEYLGSYKGILDKPFDFNVDETLVDEKARGDCPASENERRE